MSLLEKYRMEQILTIYVTQFYWCLWISKSAWEDILSDSVKRGLSQKSSDSVYEYQLKISLKHKHTEDKSCKKNKLNNALSVKSYWGAKTFTNFTSQTLTNYKLHFFGGGQYLVTKSEVPQNLSMRPILAGGGGCWIEVLKSEAKRNLKPPPHPTPQWDIWWAFGDKVGFVTTFSSKLMKWVE